MAGQWIIWVHDSTDKSYRAIIGNRIIYIMKKQIYIYIYLYIYPLTNCSIETYVQSYWRSCLLLTRRLSSTHLHNQLWINNLHSPSDQIISLPKQLEFQKFVPIFFVVSWPFCQDRPCSLAPIIHRKNLLWMHQLLSYAYPWQSPCGSLLLIPNLSHQASMHQHQPCTQPFLRSCTKAAKDGNRILEGLRGAVLKMALCWDLATPLESRFFQNLFFFQIWRYVFWISLQFW